MLTQNEDFIRKWCLKHGEREGQGEGKAGSWREDCYKVAASNENSYSTIDRPLTIPHIMLTLNANLKV